MQAVWIIGVLKGTFDEMQTLYANDLASQVVGKTPCLLQEVQSDSVGEYPRRDIVGVSREVVERPVDACAEFRVKVDEVWCVLVGGHSGGLQV